METERDKLIKASLKPGCICKGIRLNKIIEAINKGARSFQKISEMTGIGTGSCRARRCGPKVRGLLKK